MADTIIQLPCIKPLRHQVPFFGHMMPGGPAGKRAYLIWARRHGKDASCMALTGWAAFDKPATYWICMPLQSQIRKAFWLAVDDVTGERRIDMYFPKEIRRSTHEQDMRITLINGSVIMFVGSDNVDSLVGSPPYGVVFSEFALCKPKSWALIRPILTANGGWVVFNTTPREKNHAFDMYEAYRDDPNWFVSLVPASQAGILSPETLARERADYIRENGEAIGRAFFEQEYECSFNGATVGAYYAHLIEAADREGRICDVPYDPNLLVETGFDLGHRDSTAIWFVQQTPGGLVRVIDYHEDRGKTFDHYAGLLREKPYRYAPIQLPHDGESQHVLAVGGNAQQILKNYGFTSEIVTRARYDEQVNAARSILPRCVFDKDKTKEGRDALINYRATWNTERKILSREPVHDWSSHGASAFATYALGMKQRNVPAFQAPSIDMSAYFDLGSVV